MASLKCSGGTVFEGYTNQSGQPPEPPTLLGRAGLVNVGVNVWQSHVRSKLRKHRVAGCSL